MTVLIVGAGVAGATLAALLGANAVLIGPPPDPGPRIGESLPGFAADWLHRRGLPGPLSPGAPHRKIPGSVTTWHGPPIAKSYMGDPWGAHFRLDRPAFDRALYDAALTSGAQVCPIPATALAPCGAGWRITLADGTEHIGAHLVDATGRRAWASRFARRDRLEDPAQIAVWGLGRQTHLTDRRTFTQANEDGWWYGAILPDDRPLACLHCDPATAKALLAAPQLWRDRLARAQSLGRIATAQDFAATPLHATDARGLMRQPVAGANWTAIGDAAIAFDPIAAHGISFALFSAEAAKNHLAGADGYPSFCARQWQAYRARRHELTPPAPVPIA